MSGQPAGALRVEVVYALRGEQQQLALEVPAGATVRDAVERSGLLRRFPELDAGALALGIFGKVVAPDTLLRDGDRIELYRPLLADPKDARRGRARRR